MTVVLDNEALYDICKNKLKIENPNYSDINKIIAQNISSITASSRFNHGHVTDFDSLKTNLMPTPNLNFVVTSYAPFKSSDNRFS